MIIYDSYNHQPNVSNVIYHADVSQSVMLLFIYNLCHSRLMAKWPLDQIRGAWAGCDYSTRCIDSDALRAIIDIWLKSKSLDHINRHQRCNCWVWRQKVCAREQ